jgi:hypothetical protein
MHSNPGTHYPQTAGAALDALIGIAARRLPAVPHIAEAARPRAGVAR